ncbi:hypothetical protein EJD97_024469 [Solanum chilense]|uniref:Nodulin-like domain-containing protein n=1 Tax=Solanum chilense TaxID=4083 RepID=A0A6N2C1F6_SOLCI|nr:hypothetical protein EJD97_024469 [Solanum chilense]
MAVVFIHNIPPSSTSGEDKDEVNYFGMFNVVAVVIAVYLLAFAISAPRGTLISQLFAAISKH